MSNPKNITLVTHGIYAPEVLDEIALEIQREFNLPVNIIENRNDLAPYFDPQRKQYDGNKLLKAMSFIAPENAIKTIGLFRVDLFIPILTYIFGQAIFKGDTGIVSMYRLRNELYGLEADKMLMAERFKKVVIHELGHAFGLKHCHVPKCVMISSTYVEDLDQKAAGFCPSCKNLLI